MTRLFLRLFVKDYEKSDSAEVHSAVGKMAGITGIVCNFLLCVIKLVAGLLSGAVSIIADALNNLSDAASSVVTLLGFRLAQRPADRDHPYGHARYEYLSGLVVAVLILLIGAELATSSVRRIFHPTKTDISWVTFAVLICSICVKFWMNLFFNDLGKRINSSVLKAAAVDSRNDVISTGAVLAGCVVQSVFSVNVDGYVGLGVALFILYSGIGVAKETMSPLLGERADQALVERISTLILSHDKVLGIHDLLVHDYGPGQCFASVHVELSANEDPLICHDMIDCIEWDMLEKLNVHMVIHYDPVVENDAEWDEMRSMVQQAVESFNKELSFHDFRVVRGATKPKLVFDVAVPYGVKLDRSVLKQYIDDTLLHCGKEYTTVIHFDEK